MTIQVINSAPVTGAGYLTAGASALISAATFDTLGAGGLPTTPTLMTFYNVGATSYIRPFGGTASATVGVPIGTVQSFTVNITNPSLVTVFCATSSAFSFSW